MSQLAKTKERHAGVELLRILAMLMVLTLHFLIKGKYSSSSNFFVNLESWLLVCFSVVAVNCYVLISGYFMCDKSFKLKRITNTYAQMWFYSVVAFLVAVALGFYEFSYGNLLKSVLPFVFENYWFVSVYIILMIFSPLLNSAIKNMDKKKMKLVLFLLVGVFCVINTIVKPLMPIDDSAGYGIVWFIVLYLTASYIHKFYTPKGKSLKFFLLYLLTVVLNFGWHFVFATKGAVWWDSMVRDYNNILVYAGAVLLFLAFLNINIKKKTPKRIICFVAPLTFAVYLIHESPYVFPQLWKTINEATWCVDNGLFIFFAIGTVVAIFICCCIVEFVRQLAFKYLGINRAINFLSDKVESVIRNKIK